MFGISTHLYIGDRLDRDHLVEVAAHGFDAVEVFAVKSHFDYRDRRAAIALAEWLDAQGCREMRYRISNSAALAD